MIRVDGFAKRTLIRRTWATSALFPDMTTVFVMGLSADATINKRVSQEAQQYKDIIQGPFMDTYRNLTQKSLSAWKWILENCSSAKYIVKIDDDFVLNSLHFMEYLRSNDQSEITFYCDVVYDGKPRKDKSDKWYVSDDEYEKVYNLTSYPTFCLGPAYIMTADLIQKLYEQSFDVRLFWLEDIYTSLLASRVSNVTFVQFNEKYAKLLLKYIDIT